MQATLAPLAAPPLTTHWNPQLDLFAQLPAVGAAGGGPLWREQWQKQAGRLAHLDGDPAQRQAASAADRQRPGPELLPRLSSYDWAWPGYTQLSVNPGFALAPLPKFRLTGLQTAPQREALAELLQEIGQHIAFALSRPCPVYETEAQVRIELLGRIAWVADREQRCLRLELRDAEGRWRAGTRGFNPLAPLADPDWLEQALLPWLPQIEARFGPGAQEAHDWLLQKLELRFIKSGAVKACSKQITLSVLCQPVLARLLLRVYRYRRWGVSIAETYRLLWHNEKAWMQLRLRSPRLMLLHYLFINQELLKPGDGVAELRARCRALGLGPAGWRFLCRHGEWAFEGLIRPSDGRTHLPVDLLLSYVQWQAEAGLRRPLPACYAEAIREKAIDWRDENTGDCVVALDPRFARLTEAHLPPPHGDGLPPIPFEDWHRCLDWFAVLRPQPDRNQWRSGWPALARASADWDLRREKYRWDSAVGEFEQGQWRIRPLTRGRELLDEGQRLQHCVGDYIARCLRGEYRVFTVEHAYTGQPRATVGLRHSKTEGWQIDQVRGRQNTEPDDGMKDIAWEIGQRYARAM